MKKLFIYCSSFLLTILLAQPAFSQKLTIGILSGYNFAKPQGYFSSGKWEIKNGPVAGLFFNYEIVKSFSIQTEFDYTTVNYLHKTYSRYYYGYGGVMPMNSFYIAPNYYNAPDERWEYTFCRIPFYLKYSTPTKLRLELAFGGYYSICTKYEIPAYSYPIYIEYIDDVYIPNLAYNTPPKHDAGLYYSIGLSYPIAENFSVNLQGRYFAGKRTYINRESATNGVGELVFGLGYTGLMKTQKKVTTAVNDSATHSVTVTVKSGILFSKNAGSDNNHMYSNATGFATGLSFIYRFSKHFALQSEVVYEKKGYALKGKSNSFFKYTPGGFYDIDNSVSFGYVTIPILLNVRFGQKYTVYFNLGVYEAMRTSARCTGIAYSSFHGETGYQLTKTTVNDDIDASIESDDWGWALGGGFQYPVFKKYKIELEARYNTSNKNLYRHDNSYVPLTNEDSEIKNKSVNITLGFQIPLN